MHFKSLVIIVLGLVPGSLFSQLPSVQTMVLEDLMVEERFAESDPDELAAVMDQQIHPLDLNAATSAELEASGIFTVYQLQNFLEYRDRFGPLLSVYELSLIRGFRSERLRELESLVFAGHGPVPAWGRKSPGELRCYLRMKLPDAAPPYAGSSLQSGLTMRYGLNRRWTAGLSLSKDAGEVWGGGRNGGSAGAFLHYRGARCLEEFILGNYRLNLGLGLMYGNGFPTGASGFHMRKIYSRDIRPYAGFQERGLRRGIALQMRLAAFSLQCWASHENIDLGLGDVNTDSGRVDWTEYMRVSGLYRTENESEGRSLARQVLAGSRLALKKGNLEVAMLGSAHTTYATARLMDSLGVGPRGRKHFDLAIQARWMYRTMELYTEAVMQDAKRAAINVAMRTHLNDYLQLGGLGYHYSREYQDQFSGAFTAGSHPVNERGILLHLAASPSRLLEAEAHFTYFHRPAPSYSSIIPSFGMENMLILSASLTPSLNWRLRVSRRIWDEDGQVTGPGLPEHIRRIRSRMDVQVVLSPNKKTILSLRYMLKHQHDQSSIMAQLALLQLDIHPTALLKLKIQALAFSIPEWDLRLSVYDPLPYRQFSFPVYNGRGQRISLLGVIRPLKKTAIELKYAWIMYTDRASLGTGYEAVPVPYRHELGLQIRRSF